MNNRMKKTVKSFIVSLSLLGVVAATLASSVTTVSADAPYKTYTVDGYGDVSETQTAYLPYETITKIGDESLTAPTDFTLLSDGTMFILDSGAGRVVVADENYDLVATFGEGILVGPRGIYVTEDHITYVADRDANAVFVFDAEYNLIKTYTKPTEAMYGETQSFLPIKIVVNTSGTMYVICESNTNGIVEISPVDGGTFLGYFGTNATSASLWTKIWRSLQTDAQRAKQVSNLPATPDNLAIDAKGIIYTVTRGEKSDTVKRLNIAGSNMTECEEYPEVPACICAGNHDNLYVATTTGFIYEYNNDGDLLFMFGGSDDGTQRIGLSTKVEAIQIDDEDKIYILDSDKAQIQVYEPTEFTTYLHEALYLFSKGRYTESKEPLTEVLKMNNLFTYANKAMGKALYKEGDYESALSYAKLAHDEDLYSDSYWEIRNDWLKDYLSPIFIAIIVLVVVIFVLKRLDKKKHILDAPRRGLKKAGDKKLLKELRYMFFFMKHPIDGSYGIKREGRVSVLSTNIILVVSLLWYIINKYFAGFLFKSVRDGEYEIFSDILILAVALVLVVGCNYLICTINDGEGRFRDIYCSFIHCLAPYVILMPIIFILSHIVTENEAFFVSFGYFLMYAWMIVLFIIAVREINNYNIGETVKVILLTAFTILIVCLLAFILYVLWSQVFDFVESIVGEVVYRIGS